MAQSGFARAWDADLELSSHVAAFEGDLILLESLVYTEEAANQLDATGATPLHHAASGREACVDFLLHCGSEVDALTEEGKTALHIAAYQGALACAKLLVAHGAALDIADSKGETALHKATLYDHPDVVRLLLEKQASVNLQTLQKKAALHIAVETGHLECAKILLENGAELNMVDCDKNTALHIASLHGHPGCVEALLLHNADRTLVNASGAVPLHNATFIGNDACTKLLCDQAPAESLSAKDNGGITPMHHTCFSGYSDCLKQLLDAGADYKAADNMGYTPLHLASYSGHDECVKLILEAAAKTSAAAAVTQLADNKQSQPLHKAAFEGHPACVTLLLEHGASPSACDQEGATPLHKAAFSGHDAVVKLLLEASTDSIDKADNDGDTPLHKAAYKGHDDSVDVLLQFKANKNLLDKYGRSPVHNSAASGNLSCLDRLIDETNVNMKDGKGRTPLHVACKAGQLEAVQYLVCKVDIGIEVDSKDNDNHTPLFDAVENAYEGIARELIVEAGASVEEGNCFELADRPQTIMSRSALESLMEDRKRRERMKDMLDPETRAKVSRLVVLFNSKPSKGLTQMIEQGVIGRTPKEIAEFLHNHEKLSKGAIGELLGEEKYLDVLKAFTKALCFEGKTFEQSLRMYLSTFRLPGEAQKIDRIMETFATHFYEQTEDDVFANQEAAFVLSFSVIMLNTDAHNPAIKKSVKMTKEQFVRNNRGINDGGNIDQDYLEHIYDAIVQEEIKMKDDNSVFTNAEKKGWLTKQGGRVKTWKRRWFVLTNNCLYYFKSPKDEKNPCGWIPLENLDIKPGHIRGKQKWTLTVQSDMPGRMIKSCKLVDGQVVPGSHSRFVISASSEEELKSWMSAINASMQDNPLLDALNGDEAASSTSTLPPPTA